MTAKRDLKKRVRDRQAKTGESYTAARRHVLAARPDTDTDTDTDTDADADADTDAASDADATSDADADTGAGAVGSAAAVRGAKVPVLAAANAEPPSRMTAADVADAHLRSSSSPRADAEPARSNGDVAPIAVDSLVDISATATKVGLRCQVLMTDLLADAFDPERILVELRSLLLATLRDPTTDLLRAVALHGDNTEAPLRRARDPRQVQFLARLRAGHSSISSDGRALGFHLDEVAIVCSVWRHQATLVVTRLEDVALLTLSGLGTGTVADLKATPILWFENQRIPMLKPHFVIGRDPACDLQIRDGAVSRRHAEVLRTDRGWFIKDLGSENGLHYMGMKIDNKRLEHGDVYELGSYAIRFTYG